MIGNLQEGQMARRPDRDIGTGPGRHAARRAGPRSSVLPAAERAGGSAAPTGAEGEARSGQGHVAEYIASMSRDLSGMAAAQNYAFLSYLLNMAHEEARQKVARPRERARSGRQA
jgi:hypothetical protein